MAADEVKKLYIQRLYVKQEKGGQLFNAGTAAEHLRMCENALNVLNDLNKPCEQLYQKACAAGLAPASVQALLEGSAKRQGLRKYYTGWSKSAEEELSPGVDRLPLSARNFVESYTKQVDNAVELKVRADKIADALKKAMSRSTPVGREAVPSKEYSAQVFEEHLKYYGWSWKGNADRDKARQTVHDTIAAAASPKPAYGPDQQAQANPSEDPLPDLVTNTTKKLVKVTKTHFAKHAHSFQDTEPRT